MTTQPATVTGGTPLIDPDLPHGRLSTYTWHGCRCPDCRRTYTTYAANRSRQKAYGRWHPLADATEVRAHLATLRAAGMTRRQIADRTGVHEVVLNQLARGVTRSVRPANAEKILAVSVPETATASGIRISATAATRQLQALAVHGWPLIQVAQVARLNARNLRKILYGHKSMVDASTARAIHRVYGELWDQDPARHGVVPRRIRTVQRLAAEHRWAPALAWDDDTISDPEARPDWTARCGTPGGYYDHSQIGTPTCQPCRDAVAAAATVRKLKRRARVQQAA